MKELHKVILYIVILCLILTPLSPLLAGETSLATKPSIFEKAKKWFSGNLSSNRRKIKALQDEIKNREKVLVAMDKFMTDATNNARPRCAGGTVTVSFPDDPREEIRSEILELKKKIKKLQD